MEIKDFAKNNRKPCLNKAKKQQKELSFFITSEPSKDINNKILNASFDLNSDEGDFINHIKTIFRKDNYKTFIKYLKFPLVTTTLIEQKIIPEFKRVFFSDDSYFKISVKNEIIPIDKNRFKFYDDVLERMIYKHNDLAFIGIDEKGSTYCDFIDINDVLNIEFNNKKEISKIVFNSVVDGQEGYIYIDDLSVNFYNKETDNLVFTYLHKLSYTPCFFISNETYFIDKDFSLRKSIFSKIMPLFNEYVFLKTIQQMTEPNGAIPITTRLKSRETTPKGQNLSNKTTDDNIEANLLAGNYKSEDAEEYLTSESILQPGTVLNIKAPKLDTGGVDMSVVQNYLRFFYIPVESLNYLNERVKEIEKNIITLTVGDYSEQNNQAINELQVSKSYQARQDVLRNISLKLSDIVQKIEKTKKDLIHKEENVNVQIFFGSDFFIEEQKDIYSLIKLAPNPIEKRNLLYRLSNIKNRYNDERILRDKILYSLLPFEDNEDFDKVITLLSKEQILLQTQFNYFINLFESEYGDIVFFYENIKNEKENIKLAEINNLLINFVKRKIKENEIDTLKTD